MIDLLNDLTLHFVWLLHNFELEDVTLKFRVLPTMGTTVATVLTDWIEFNVSLREGTAGYSATIGKSKDDVWALILAEWTKYPVHTKWMVDVQTTPDLTEPDAPVPELRALFEYVTEKGVK